MNFFKKIFKKVIGHQHDFKEFRTDELKKHILKCECGQIKMYNKDLTFSTLLKK